MAFPNITSSKTLELNPREKVKKELENVLATLKSDKVSFSFKDLNTVSEEELNSKKKYLSDTLDEFADYTIFEMKKSPVDENEKPIDVEKETTLIKENFNKLKKSLVDTISKLDFIINSSTKVGHDNETYYTNDGYLIIKPDGSSYSLDDNLADGNAFVGLKSQVGKPAIATLEDTISVIKEAFEKACNDYK